MIDYLTIVLTHGLMAVALWRLLWRDDLDREGSAGPAQWRPWVKRDNGGSTSGGSPASNSTGAD